MFHKKEKKIIENNNNVGEVVRNAQHFKHIVGTPSELRERRKKI